MNKMMILGNKISFFIKIIDILSMQIHRNLCNKILF